MYLCVYNMFYSVLHVLCSVYVQTCIFKFSTLKDVMCENDLVTSECYAVYASYCRVNTCVGKEDGKTCKRVAIRTTIRKDDCRSNAPVREERHTDRKSLQLSCLMPPAIILSISSYR